MILGAFPALYAAWLFYSDHRARKGKARIQVEPSHLIWAGFVMVACGLVWQTFWPSIKTKTAKSVAMPGPARAVPVFTTQYDRERFRSALDDLSGLVNNHVREIIQLSNNVAGVHPLIGRGRGRGAMEPAEKLEHIREKCQETERLLFSGGTYSAFFDKYPVYRQEFVNFMPGPSQWNAYNKALRTLTTAVSVVLRAEKYPNDNQLFEAAIAGLDPIQEQFIQATNSLKEWVDLLNQKIAELARAS
jgi:hypothetical protein